VLKFLLRCLDNSVVSSRKKPAQQTSVSTSSSRVVPSSNDDDDNNDNDNNNNDSESAIGGNATHASHLPNEEVDGDMVFMKDAGGILASWRCNLCQKSGACANGSRGNGNRHFSLNPENDRFLCVKKKPAADPKQTVLSFATAPRALLAVPNVRLASSQAEYRAKLLRMVVQCFVPFHVLQHPAFLDFAVLLRELIVSECSSNNNAIRITAGTQS
jgi:hypothetical protein